MYLTHVSGKICRDSVDHLALYDTGSAFSNLLNHATHIIAHSIAISRVGGAEVEIRTSAATRIVRAVPQHQTTSVRIGADKLNRFRHTILLMHR